MNQKNKARGKFGGNHQNQNREMTVNNESSASDFIPLERTYRDNKDGKRSRPRKSRAHKKPRLIVRNLPYKSTEESVRKHFEPYGEVTDVVLLRKPNKQLVGCGFVQFSKATNAAKAIAHTSGKQFLGRPIAVDWAIPKDQYLKKSGPGEAHDEVKIKKEEDSSSDASDSDVRKNKGSLNKSVNLSDDEEDDDEDDEEDEDDGEDDIKNMKIKFDDESDYDDEDEDEDDDKDESDFKKGKKLSGSKNREQDKKPRFESNDVKEGRTVFLRNLPFSVDNDKLQDFAEEFGPVVYAVVCMDPKSDHSRGTGFIKFQNADDANRCITQSQNKELVLDNRTIDVTPALSRDDAQKSMSKEKVKKDNRNLYLLKEGLVTAGSPAAEGVSPADMEKRIHLERWKTKTLRDLTMFVSRVRLVVHNIPPSCDDAKLRSLFLQHGGFKPRITEARVMRDLKNVDANGVGRSKEYGFVTFTNHENALEALRNINNNPRVFGPNKRPIVSFSIEDKKMLNVRKRRQERSLMKNPTWKHYKKEHEDDANAKQKKMKNKKGSDKTPANKTQANKTQANKTPAGKAPAGGKPQVGNKRKNSDAPAGPAAKAMRPFMGSVSKVGEGGTTSLRKLKDQSQIVRQNAKEKKKQAKQKKKPERIKEKAQKQPKKQQREEKDGFSDMVNKYKASLASAPAARSKWYE